MTLGRGAAISGSERGIVLLWAVVMLTAFAGLIAAGLASDAALDRATRIDLAVRGQARAVAEAGVVDAFAWFRRQQVQPTTNFAPRLDPDANPPVNETDDPSIGLVREYEIGSDLWARYEVPRPVPAEPFTDSDGDGRYGAGEPFVDMNANEKWDAAHGTTDVSLERGLSGAGGSWRIESRGAIFIRPDPTLPLGTPPNDRISSSVVAAEIRRLTVTPPTGAAICADSGSKVTIGPRGRIAGGIVAGIAYRSGTGTPVIQSGSEVTGTPTTVAPPDYSTALEKVFGVGAADLRSMADASTLDPSVIPSPLGDYTLTVLEGSITFNEARPLRGTGILVVLGDCTLTSGSNSFFSGLLYVAGNLTVRAPAFMRGVVIVQGLVDVRGTGGDYVEVHYDDAVIGEILRRAGQYRHSKTVFDPGQAEDGE